MSRPRATKSQPHTKRCPSLTIKEGAHRTASDTERIMRTLRNARKSQEQTPILSLFCGAGGMDLGFRDEGFDPVLALDNNETAISSYNWNRKRNVAKFCDLSSATGEDIIKILREVAPGIRPRGVIGGPPCQSFSTSNVHRKNNDPRAELPLRYAEILNALNKEFGLDFFVFENVIGLKSKKHEGELDSFLKSFEEAGFNLFEEELNAGMFGVAQNRRRVFIVGINKRLYPNVIFKFPKGAKKKRLTVSDVIGGLPEPVFFRRNIPREEIPYHPNHWTMNPKSPKFTNGSIKVGRSFRKLKWDHPSWTVAYGHREIHVHPNGTRRVSVFEALQLQSFPRGYELQGNLSQQVEQVSNAVPPLLGGAIAAAIRATIYDPTHSLQKNLLDWFEQNERSFPWRKTKDAYRIMVAEKLLQQTAATEHVVTAYRTIMRLYPNFKALSKAKPSALRRIVAPLGFTYRATELSKLAQTIIDSYGGKIPGQLEDLLALPGVGDYIARAILSFAYGQDVAIVDTNIARLLHRFYGIAEQIPSNPARSKHLNDLAARLIPQGRSRDFNLAALDLCASICTARQPNCAACPIVQECDMGQKKSRLITI